VTQTPEPIIRLTGDLRKRGADWNTSEFELLFERLGAIVGGKGGIKRHVGYHGATGGTIEVRFFGIEVESIEQIPEGMIALELSEDSISVLEPLGTGTAIAWQGGLTWNCLDNSIPEAPVGEFTAHIPADWTSQPDQSQVRFVLSTNAYFEPGKVTDDDVRLVEYSPDWPARFAEMVSWLRSVISPEIVLRIEHYGSTAIPDIPAKPVIDILLEVPSFDEARQSLIPIFNKPECEYWWYNEHMLFIVRQEFMGARTHHIHVAPGGHVIWQGIAFRDYLRTHPDEAARYAVLKRELAEYHVDDREAYTDSKENFVREVTAKALRAVD